MKTKQMTGQGWVGDATAARHNPSRQQTSAIPFPRPADPLQALSSEQGHLLTHKCDISCFHGWVKPLAQGN